MMTKRKHRKPNERPMAGSLLRAWRSEMGLAERDAAARLGMSRGGLRNAEADGAPLYIALACAALITGLDPYGLPNYYKEKHPAYKEGSIRTAK